MKEEPLSFLDVTTFWLSIYVLTALAVQVSMPLSQDTLLILNYADFLVCAVFFADFCRRLWIAPSKFGYLKWGWLDLLASIPMVDLFRVGRIYRLWKIVRVLRALRSSRAIVSAVHRRRAQNTLALVATTSFTAIFLAAILVLEFEKDAGGNIAQPIDALWWAVCTVTTVGYGDFYPVTSEGRVAGVLLMTLGVGLFGTFAGYLGSIFIGPQSQPKVENVDALKQHMTELQETVLRLENLMKAQQESHQTERT